MWSPSRVSASQVFLLATGLGPVCGLKSFYSYPSYQRNRSRYLSLIPNICFSPEDLELHVLDFRLYPLGPFGRSWQVGWGFLDFCSCLPAILCTGSRIQMIKHDFCPHRPAVQWERQMYNKQNCLQYGNRGCDQLSWGKRRMGWILE